MQNRITGTTMPVLEFILDPDELVISEAGELSWMSSSIRDDHTYAIRRRRRTLRRAVHRDAFRGWRVVVGREGSLRPRRGRSRSFPR